MSECPNCKVQIEADFGMVTCPGCETILFVEVNGQIQVDGSSVEVSSNTPGPANDYESQEIEILNQVVENSEQNVENPYPEFKAPDQAFAIPDESFNIPDQNFETFESTQEPTFETGDQIVEPDFDPMPTIDVEEHVQPKVEGDLSEIAEFANSDISLGKDGNYLYDIIISNIDSGEVKKRLRNALEDRRFNWDVDELLSTIADGCLRICRVNSVKSTVLINRIKNLPLLVTWEQRAINQEVPSS